MGQADSDGVIVFTFHHIVHGHVSLAGLHLYGPEIAAGCTEGSALAGDYWVLDDWELPDFHDELELSWESTNTAFSAATSTTDGEVCNSMSRSFSVTPNAKLVALRGGNFFPV